MAKVYSPVVAALMQVQHGPEPGIPIPAGALPALGSLPVETEPDDEDRPLPRPARP